MWHELGLEDIEYERKEDFILAQDDIKRISEILKNEDMSNIETVARIYKQIRNSDILFSIDITRNAFMFYLADKMSINVTKRKRYKEKNCILMIIGIICILLALVLLVVYIFQAIQERKDMNVIRSIQNQYVEKVVAQDMETINEEEQGVYAYNDIKDTSEETIENTSNSILTELQKNINNKELLGWLYIPSTDVDYPVMQTTDNSFYLNHDINKNESKSGSLFLDYRNVSKDDTNLIIYGHNMANGSMFGSLDLYEDYEYYINHPTICFETYEEKSIYRVIAVCKSQVAEKEDDIFRYYNFINTDDESEKKEFLENIESCSVHKVTYEYDEKDTYLTLSTCSNFVDNGRLYIVAVKRGS